MYSLNDTTLESNKYMKIDFDGSDLSSDAGLLLVKEFICKLGFDRILKAEFKTNDPAWSGFHTGHTTYLIGLNVWHYPQKMRKQQVDTIRLKLLKTTTKVEHSARYTILQ